MAAPTTVPVHEIVRTIQGEGTRAGVPCVLVRTCGCNLSCAWCDTDQSGVVPADLGIDDIAAIVARAGVRLVEVTGGEPLVHVHVPALCASLLAAGHEVLLETNGSLDVSVLPSGVVRIMDLKPPSSGAQAHNRLANIALLTPRDEVKIVVADEADYGWAVDRIRTDLAAFPGTVLLSPLTPGMDPGTLAALVLRDGLRARMSLQLHKLLFPSGETALRLYPRPGAVG